MDAARRSVSVYSLTRLLLLLPLPPQVCNDIYVCGEGKVRRFPGSFEDYKRRTLSNRKTTA